MTLALMLLRGTPGWLFWLGVFFLAAWALN